jgi:hypothetical protein
MKRNYISRTRPVQDSLLLFFFILASFFGLSQNVEVDVRKVNSGKFPEVKGKLWVRNPEGIKTENIQFSEEERPVKVTFDNYQSEDSLAENKAILFLIRNTATNSEFNWYREVLVNAFNSGAIKPGDKIEVAGFSCKVGEQIVFPGNFEFTDDVKVLIKRIDKIQQNRRIEYAGRAQTHIAINEALNMLGNLNLNIPTGLFVLSDDRSMPPLLTGELPGPRSRNLDIPIYGISYFKANRAYEIKELCLQTYGRFTNNQKNDVKTVGKTLTSYLNEFIRRSAGIYYPFSYTSTFEKDGKSHTVKIKTKNGDTGFSLPVPSKNLLELIQDNPLVSVIIFILFVGILIVILLFVKKNKLKKHELELERKRQMADLDLKQQTANQKLSQQESEMNRLKSEESKKREREEQARKNKAQEEEDERQIRKMLERGNFPWFEYKFGDMSGNYQIQHPRITVGRDSDNHWVINHPTVSRKHIQLTFKDYVYKIRDLGSSNGLLVNDYKTTETELKHGDCIQIGEIILTFHI